MTQGPGPGLPNPRRTLGSQIGEEICGILPRYKSRNQNSSLTLPAELVAGQITRRVRRIAIYV